MGNSECGRRKEKKLTGQNRLPLLAFCAVLIFAYFVVSLLAYFAEQYLAYSVMISCLSPRKSERRHQAS